MLPSSKRYTYWTKEVKMPLSLQRKKNANNGWPPEGARNAPPPSHKKAILVCELN
jgi:hypothetical protein